MNKIERAIIMAAGKGERLHPLTLHTPKPLIEVNGQRMIESVIDSLHINGIYEIYIVVGYLKEQFYYLEQKYPEVHLVTNPWYATCNNISSLYAAREYLENVIILDGDQLIFNPQILSPEFDRSGYNAVWQDGETSEWMLEVEHGIVKSCSRIGGKHAWQLYSISRWNREDGMRLRRHLELEFEEKKNHNIYWDDVALFCYPEEYTLGIRKMQREDLVEIDDLKDLVTVDSSYSRYQVQRSICNE